MTVIVRLAAGLMVSVALGGCTSPRISKVTTVTPEDEAESRRKEIKILEQSLPEDIAKERAKGASEAEIDELKARYKARIDKIKDELAEYERSKAGSPNPDAPQKGS